MVFKGVLKESMRAYILFKVKDKKCNAKKLAKELGVSFATIYRIKRQGVQGLKNSKLRRYSPGRPPKLTVRSQRNLLRLFKSLRAENPNIKSTAIQRSANLENSNISNRTIRRVLHRDGLEYRSSRKKRSTYQRRSKETISGHQQ